MTGGMRRNARRGGKEMRQFPCERGVPVLAHFLECSSFHLGYDAYFVTERDKPVESQLG